MEGVVTLLELAALALWALLILGALAVVLVVCGLVGEWRRGVGGEVGEGQPIVLCSGGIGSWAAAGRIIEGGRRPS